MEEAGLAKEFSVYQWFADGQYECVRKHVEPEEAVKAAHHYTTNVAARTGMVNRVMITDGGDCCVFEWRNGRVIWPTKEAMEESDG